MESKDNRRQLFRAKSLDRLSSPEELSDYVRVANPGVWVTLVAIVILLIGMIVWSVFGRLETTIDAVCVASDGKMNCYISEENINKVKLGMKVTTADGTECSVVRYSPDASIAEDVLSDYAMHLANFEEGEWIHALYLDKSMTDGAISAAKVTIDTVHPIVFIFG